MKKSTRIQPHTIYKFLTDYFFKNKNTKGEYFAQRLQTESHDSKNSKNNLLAEMYFQNW